MPLPSFPLTVPLEESEQEQTEIHTDLAEFGDGARQEAETGLNSVRSAGGWTFLGANDDINSAVAFLVANGVSGFQFTHPVSGAVNNYKCTSWKAAYLTGDDAKLTCQFQQIFVP